MRKYRWLLKSYLIISFWEGIKEDSLNILNRLVNFLKKLNRKVKLKKIK